MPNTPTIIRVTYADMEACVPASWTNGQATEYANAEVLCGTLDGWRISGKEACGKRDGFVHVTFAADVPA